MRDARDKARALLHETATLLSIARLDLMARIHGVTERELDQLGLVVDRKRRAGKRILPDRSRRRRQDRQGWRRTMIGT